MTHSDLEIINGDCRDALALLVSDCSVQMCVTSPPYFGLRDYGVEGQLGLEPTPDEYIAKMVDVFREVHRVLVDDGTLWLNIGDSYAGSWGSQGRRETPATISRNQIANHPKRASNTGTIHQAGLKAKDMIGIPWMLAFALRADGWYLRQEIIWHKPNPMPESVRDRCTKAHESIFLLSKSARYFIDQDGIREPAKEWHGRAATFDRSGNVVAGHVIPGQSAAQHRPRPSAKRGEFNGKTEALADEGRNAFRAVVPTRNRRSVWTVPTRPYKGAHFAVFPPALIEPCILAGSRPGDIVLDPFGGSGTTAQVALRHGRKVILCELNPAYIPLIKQRVAK